MYSLSGVSSRPDKTGQARMSFGTVVLPVTYSASEGATMKLSVRRRLPALILPLLLGSIASAGCDIVTADLRSEETASWHKTYPLDANGRLEINNVNGKIEVEPSAGNTIDITALKKARGGSPEAAKAALDRASIVEDVSSGRVKIDTKMANMSGIVLHGGNVQVEYHVKVPAGAEVKFTTVNGGIEITGLTGASPRRRPTGASPRTTWRASSTPARRTAGSTSISRASPRAA